jgi:hypothetical protein
MEQQAGWGLREFSRDWNLLYYLLIFDGSLVTEQFVMLRVLLKEEHSFFFKRVLEPTTVLIVLLNNLRTLSTRYGRCGLL